MLKGLVTFFIKKNSSRFHLENFIQKVAKTAAPSDLVLDAGAGDCRYKKHFDHCSYESADFLQVDKEYAKVDYVCDLKAIPVEDNRYDAVLFTQVLEHLPEPEAVLKELNRVLKPGGKLWLTVPFFYQEHEQPYDFHRFTQFGLKSILERTNFSIQELSWLESYFGTLSYQFKTMAMNIPVSPSAYPTLLSKLFGPLFAIGIKIWALVFCRFFAGVDIKGGYTKKGYCKNYKLIATKHG